MLKRHRHRSSRSKITPTQDRSSHWGRDRLQVHETMWIAASNRATYSTNPRPATIKNETVLVFGSLTSTTLCLPDSLGSNSPASRLIWYWQGVVFLIRGS